MFQEGVSSLESVPWGHLSHRDSGWLLELSVLGVLCTHFGSDSTMNATSSLELNGLQPVTITVGTAAAGYLAYKRFYVRDHCSKSMVNLHSQKENSNMVHAFDVEDLGDKVVHCYC